MPNHAMTIEEVLASLPRSASILEVGGFRPPDAPGASWIGAVKLSRPGADLPASSGRLMMPVLQLNFGELTTVPAALGGVSMIQFFVDAARTHELNDVRDAWCVRVFSRLEGLVPIESPSEPDWARPFPLREQRVVTDYPLSVRWEPGLDGAVVDAVDSAIEEAGHECHAGLKVGGWPLLFQDPPMGGSSQFVIQVDTIEKCRWGWPAGGTAYLGVAGDPLVESSWSVDVQFT